ncbi:MULTISPECIES: MFS transporter [Pseudomonas]|uniref:DHA1 family inner membrane transport protein n=2 Tax=Pseudomonas baetica TaxID=674054 RepID=A0ABX4Q8Y8_9PSED|nr:MULTISPECIES: MFS transporter [Pseudomonas]MDR9861941.1 MFS transporter [Pseudomonas baetica]PKA73282.1 DHA1 family inner membrane transport protein [Pseudomonas baetica]PTC18989.1 MFS transporter [Pseudomonas baetica]
MNDSTKMPFQVWILTLAAFAIGTAEFVIAGILPQVAESLAISEGQTGSLITAYALAIVVGGPLLTLWLSRFEKRNVLLGLMALFIVANLITALSQDYTVLLISRVLAGLTQGPFYGIGAVVATRLVAPQMAGRAVGQMFAGLTLANVLGVPAGAWIGNVLGWHASFFVVAALGALAAVAIASYIERQGQEKAMSVIGQLAVLRDRHLLASLMITVLSWVGFMTFYGYVAPFAEQVAGIDRSNITWVLVIVGAGLVIGNSLGGRTADANLRLSLIGWPLAMIVSLFVAYLVASNPYAFLVAAFAFGVTSFANVPALQMRVMNYGGKAPELAATANISAFNVANALGGIIGGMVIDSHFGAQAIPFAAAIIPIVGVLFILTQERKGPIAAVSLFK